MQLVLDTDGMLLKVKNKCFYLVHNGIQKTISPARVSSLLVTKNILLSSAALVLAAQKNIPVLVADGTGQVLARVQSPLLGNLPSIRRHQVNAANHPVCINWLAGIISLKIGGQCANLRYLGNRKPGAAPLTEDAAKKLEGVQGRLHGLDKESIPPALRKITALEAESAAAYWRVVGAVLPPPYSFTARSRRPATDLFNAALNYLYGMLYTRVENALLTVGLDPTLGFLHRDNYLTPSLAFDAIEAFRPLADRLLLDWCLQQTLQSSHAESRREEGLWISKYGKKFIIPAFNAWMEERCLFNGRTTALKNHLLTVAGDLVKNLKNTFDEPPYLPGDV